MPYVVGRAPGALQQDSAADVDQVEVQYRGDGRRTVLRVVTSPSDERWPVACFRLTSYRPH